MVNEHADFNRLKELLGITDGNLASHTKALEKERWSFEQINEDLAVIKLGTFAIWNWKDFDANQWFGKIACWIYARR